MRTGLTVLAVVVLGALATYCAAVAQSIRDFDHGMRWE